MAFVSDFSHAEFRVPPLSGPVMDQAQMLSPSTRQRLSSFLNRLRSGGGAQIQVLTLPDLGGLSIEEASIRIVDQWKLGSAKQDDGILLLISKAERRVRIEVGQGLEGQLPDLIASRIIREVIIPRFKSGDVDRGVIDGVLSIVHYTNPDFLEGENTASPMKGKSKFSGNFDWIIFLLLLFFFIGPAFLGRRRSGLAGGLLGYGLGRSGGGFGSSGSSWSGGGGGFSGGGASGGW